MSLLPSEPDTDAAEDAGPRVIGVDSEDADDVLAALSSGTARELLSTLHDEPAPPSRLADEVDTSLQNAQYHLEKLEAAGAVEVVDTAYSEKGREMDVYAPAAEPLVIFAGDEGESTLRSALSRLLGSVGVLAVGSLVVQYLFGEGPFPSAPTSGGGSGGAGGASGAAGGAGAPSVNRSEAFAADAATQTAGGEVDVQSVETGGPETLRPVATEVADRVTEAPEAATEAARQAPEAAGGLPAGLLFFAGGLVALAVVAVALRFR